MVNIIVAGSRDFNDYSLLEKCLLEYIQDPQNTTIISGTAKGADRLGEEFALNHNIRLIRCPADWKRFGKAAGYKRNEEMAILSKANEETGVLFAFWDGESRGTEHMISLAGRHGLEIHIINFK